MSEGLQDKQGNQKKFYKLMEDKRPNSPTLGQYRFFQQEKVNGSWTSTNEGNSMSGLLKSMNIKSYQYEGQPKEQLEIELAGKETSYVIGFGFNTQITENLLNTLANEPIIGEVELNCGMPNKAGYPTLYINHNGQKTKWKYSKENNNWNEVPVVTKENIEGTIVRRGLQAKADFWKKVMNEQVLPKLINPADSKNTEFTKTGTANSETITDVTPIEDKNDLPF